MAKRRISAYLTPPTPSFLTYARSAMKNKKQNARQSRASVPKSIGPHLSRSGLTQNVFYFKVISGIASFFMVDKCHKKDLFPK